MFKSSFSSYGQLVLTLGHEMFHANLMNAGIYGANVHHPTIFYWLKINSTKWTGPSNYYIGHKGSYNPEFLKYAPKFKK